MNYHVARNGQQLGTLSTTDISLKLSTGELSPQDLAWTEGMANWQPISSISGLSSGGGATPSSGYVNPYASAPVNPYSSGPVNPYAAPRAEIYAQKNSAELASLGQRLGAHLLNILTLMPVAVLVGIGVALEDPNSSSPGTATALLLGLSGLYIIGLFIYNMVRLSTHGQSLGKQWVGIKIVGFEDNSNAGFVKAVLLRMIVNTLIGFFVPFYGLVDSCFVFREDRRCIHDLLASTHVVVA